MLKNLPISAAVISAFGFGTLAYAEPNISISCFGDTTACKTNEIGIINNGKQTVSNLYVACPDKNNPKKLYKFWSFDLDPKETKCYNASDIGDDCYKSVGIFVAYNVDITVKSENYPKWEETDSCTWKK